MAHFLKNVALFANLSDEDLDRLCDMMERVELAAGEVLFQQDEPGDRCFVIESGELEILQSAGGRRQVQLALRRQGEVIGEMALLEERPRSATVRARSPSVLLTLNRAQFNELLETSPSAARAMFQIVLQRLRSSQAALMQSERLAQLGQLTAGLTHELNNPASAVRRGTNQLEQVVLDFAQGYREQSRLEFDAQQTAVCERLSTLARQRAQNPPEMDTLLRSDREAELEEWLERHMVERAWELAPGLVNLNLRPAELDELADLFDTDALEVILRWLVAVYMTFNLFAEIGEGAARISSLVDTLKQYVYLDQAPMQAVDIQQGLDKTLLILQHKLKKSEINVRREYEPELPSVDGRGSELNQVWTNLIDNAIDALMDKAEAEKTLWIRAYRQGDAAVVEVEDNGPGIPAEAQDRIFTAFFTTKPPGKGTGLGLPISYNIVVDKHDGDIRVESAPGRTLFRVYLPINEECVLPPRSA